MAEAMETEMECSDGEQTNANAHVAASQYIAPPMYNRTNLVAAYGNSAIVGLEKGIERRQDHHEQLLPGYIFMCNGRTKTDCYRYRVFGIPRGRLDVVESIKPGMKLFLYDFEKKLLYGVYEATSGGRLDIEPEAFDKKYPAQVGFRIVMNCYPLPENAFRSAIYENYNGSKFKQELAPHQVMSLLSLFRPFTAPELDSLPQRFASRASAPRTLSFEERFIAATHLRNGLDPLSARHAEPRLGSLMTHQSVPRTPLLQHSYSRQDDYTTPPRESPSLSNLNQPYFPTESRQQRLLGDPPRSSIQDPQLKYLTILSNIRRYGSAPERLAPENEYHPETPSEKDQFASPYSDNKYYPSTLSGNEQPSASAANGFVYRSEFYTSASQKEGEASQQHEISANTYHPEASTVPNTTVSMQSDMQVVSAQYHTKTAGYPTPTHVEASQPAAGAIGYTHHPQSVAGNTTHPQPGGVEESRQSYAGTVSYPQPTAGGYAHQPQSLAGDYTTHPQPGGVEESTQSHAGTVSYPQPTDGGYAHQPQSVVGNYTTHSQPGSMEERTQSYAGTVSYPQPTDGGYAHQPQSVVGNYTTHSQPGSMEERTQSYAGTVSYPQQQYHAAMGHTTQLYAGGNGYIHKPHETGYAQQPGAPATGYAQQAHAAATGYAQQAHAAETGYAQQAHAAATAYAQQAHAAATAYALQPHAAATGYALQPHAQAVGYTTQPYAQAVGYMPQYHPQAIGYSQQAVTQGSVQGPPGIADWNAANQAYPATGDWNAVNQSYYPQAADATIAYNQTS